MKAVEVTRAEPLYKRVVDYNDYEDFEWVALERKFDARPIETERLEGWAFFELDAVDPAKGGAPRAHVDALRLMAVLLAHWDNKSENQRLVCLGREWPEGARAQALPGAAGRRRHVWTERRWISTRGRSAAIWEDRASCTRVDARPAVRRRHVRPRGHHRGRPALSRRAAVAALGSAVDRSLRQARASTRSAASFSAAHASPTGCACSKARCTRSPTGRRARRRRRSAARARVASERSRIDRRARSRDRLKVQLVVFDLDQHEVIVVVVGASDVRRGDAVADAAAIPAPPLTKY